MMKILFLTPQFPYPPRQGTTIRNYNLIRLLAEEHTIDLFTFVPPGEQIGLHNRLSTHCQRVVTAEQPTRSLARRAVDSLIAGRPDMGLRLESQEAYHRLYALLDEEQYDLIQVEGIEMAAYGLAAVEKQSGARLIFDNHNAEYLLQKRSALVDMGNPLRWLAACYSLIQWKKLCRYEQMVCSRSDAVVAVSEPDRSALVQLVPDRLIDVVPNGIDLNEYPYTPTVSSARIEHTSKGNAPAGQILVFTGKMDYRPNVDAILWFAQEVLPLIQTQQAGAQLQVVGMNPHRRLFPLAGQSGIEMTGAVEDVRPYVHRAAVYVVPLRVGGGTRFKVLEALASSKAMVSTSLGVEGLGLQDGRELLIADDPQAFADAVLRLLADQADSGNLCNELASAGRQFVESHFSWEQIIPRLTRVHQAALHREPLTDI